MSLRSLIRSRTLGVALGAMFIVACFGAVPVAYASGPLFTFSGGGFGHGIGMSQYGAYGYALNGWSYDDILEHYYTGASVDRIADITTDVKVNLDPAYIPGGSYAGKSSWTVRAMYSRLKVWNGSTTKYFSSGANVCFTYNEALDRVEAVSVSNPTDKATFYGDVWAAPETTGKTLEVYDASGGYGAAHVQYRGKFFFDRRSGSKLDLINHVPMQHYLYGVVPREMPSGWSAEALKVQAVAARSYSYGNVISGGVLACTTSSQMYCGYGYENSSGQWVGEADSTNTAVDATDDVVVRYNGKVIVTYFSSQSGGHTANIEDVWVPSDGDLAAKAAEYPYLRGVVDPYEKQAGAPNVPWTGSDEKTFDGTALADKLRASSLSGVPASPAYVTGVSVEAADTGHARYVTFTFSSGGTVKTTGNTVRSLLGLKSTYFYVGPPYSRISGADRYATSVELSKKAFSSTAPVVVLASGQDFPDALSGAGLAGDKHGSLLLTMRDEIPSVVKNEIKRLNPGTVYIMGGTAVVSDALKEQVQTLLPSAGIVRVGGRDRFETSGKAAELIGARSTAVIVNGLAWPDAVAAAGLAYGEGAPMLLTSPESLSGQAQDYLEDARPETILMVGGSAVLSDQVRAQAQAAAGVAPLRLEGLDRYYTSARVAKYARDTLGFSDETPLFVSGEAYPDALSAGTLSGSARRVMLLTGSERCWGGTEWATSFLDDPTRIWIVGGSAAISSAGVSSLQVAYALP